MPLTARLFVSLQLLADSAELGLGAPIPLSAEGNDGMLAALPTHPQPREVHIHDAASKFLCVECSGIAALCESLLEYATPVANQAADRLLTEAEVRLQSNRCSVSDTHSFAHALGQANPAQLDEAIPVGIPRDALSLDQKVKAASQMRFAIVGRPNVGKSTLTNQLVQADRMLTGPT